MGVGTTIRGSACKGQASRRWSQLAYWPMEPSSLLADGADLLHETQQVQRDPAFDRLPVLDAPLVDVFGQDGFAGRLYAHEVALVGAGEVAPGRNHGAGGDDLF